MRRFIALFVVALSIEAADDFTRGVGLYPGRPAEYAAPAMKPGPNTIRNLALHRPVYQSSAYDYNLTAMLLTDGVVETAPPRWIAVSTSENGTLAKHRRERLFDGNWVTALELKGATQLPFGQAPPWIVLEFGGGSPDVDRLDVVGMVKAGGNGPENWSCIVSGSEDGRTWRRLGMASGMTHSGGEFVARVSFENPSKSSLYRLQLVDARARMWTIQEMGLSFVGEKIPIGGPFTFTSSWKSAGAEKEWVYVDLGEVSLIDRVVLAWLKRPLQGAIEVSTDAKTWTPVMSLPGAGERDDLKMPSQMARYLRVRMDRPLVPEGYELSELEVWGTGGLVPVPLPMPVPQRDGSLDLTRGAWRVQRDSLVKGDGKALSLPGFDDGSWIPATVPGTTLTSYVNAGAIAEPNFGDNQLLISDSFFYADFWYRNEFVAPVTKLDRLTWLGFDGINWKAEVFLNGQPIGRIEGAFSRRRFDVTKLLIPGKTNVLAVRVEKNAHPGCVKEKTFEEPGENGGVLGVDNPTFHASIGWDWIPTIRGRDTGIWDRVYLTSSGPVTLETPEVRTTLPLPDTSSADVNLAVTLRNHTSRRVQGQLRGRFGDVSFHSEVSLEGGVVRSLRLDPTTHPQLHLTKPRLWWPNGYGEPNTYDVELSFVPQGEDVSDVRHFQAGVRQITATPAGQPLQLWVNGRRFIPKGGNWGFSESMLRYRAREYDAALRYHRDMNFNMVRNWLGMIGQDAFYEACDRNGIMVWQDFWLANPWDGDDPADSALFMKNATELVKRIRTHPSIGLFCGRNEGYPPKDIEDGIRTLLAEEYADVPFVPSSADGDVSGYGPYQAQPVGSYTTSFAKTKLHSEMGMPNIPTLESVKLMMPDRDLWPPGRMWGMHDFCLNGAQGGKSFLEMLTQSYGPASSAQQWTTEAQFLNYDGYRAMYEAQNINRMGLLIWMSHPAWPSFVWQTYDYYLAPTAGYFGAKKACEPLHVQWNPGTNRVEVVNSSAGDRPRLEVSATIYGLDGAQRWQNAIQMDSQEDSTSPLFRIERPEGITRSYVLRLRLMRGDEILSANDYLRSVDPNGLQDLHQLQSVNLQLKTIITHKDERWLIQARLHNPSQAVAVMVNLVVRREKSGDRILPALYSDNYFNLLPGEGLNIDIEVRQEDTRNEKPCVELAGTNVLRAISCGR